MNKYIISFISMSFALILLYKGIKYEKIEDITIGIIILTIGSFMAMMTYLDDDDDK